MDIKTSSNEKASNPVVLRNEMAGYSKATNIRYELLILLSFLVMFAYFFPRWADWNQNSRFALTLAMAEQNSFSIDDYYWRTGDYAIYKEHRYSDKAPGLSFLAVPPYLLFRGLAQLPPIASALDAAQSNNAFGATLREGGTGVDNQKVSYAAALYFVTFFTVSLPSAFLWVLVYRFLGNITNDRRMRMLVVLSLGLGTVAVAYSGAFYSHMTGAFLVFAAFYLLVQMKFHVLGKRYLWIAGAALGLAFIVDFPTLAASCVVITYAWSFLKQRRQVSILAFAFLPFVFLLGYYNFVCFGSPFSSSYRYLALFQEQANYGMLGFSFPQWQAFWGITFSPFRGLFFSSPFLLLIWPGFWLWFRKREMRAEGLACASVVILYLFMISSYFDWKGGFAVAGPRNLITLVPFTGLPLLYFLRWAVSRRWILAATVVITIIGMLAFAVQVAGGQDYAPITFANPLFEFFWPRLLNGDVNRNLGMLLHLVRWYSLLPLCFAMAIIVALLWHGGRGGVWPTSAK